MNDLAASVYLLWHVRDPDDLDTAKLIGVFTSRRKAAGAKRQLRNVDGFAEYPDAYIVDEYQLDELNWKEGFVSL
jgi:hypothetical protein